MKNVSEKRLAANRANAAKSTGPRTPEGKSRASLNARKHGLVTAAVSILRLEAEGELDNLKADAIAHYQPRDAQEMFAVERIAVAQLMMLRGLEACMFIKCLNMFLNEDESPMHRIHSELFPLDRPVQIQQNRNYAMSEGFDRIARSSNIWSLILRYQAQVERQYRRAIEELERLRRDFPNEPTSDPEPQEIKEETPAQNEPIEPAESTASEPEPTPRSNAPAPSPQPPTPSPRSRPLAPFPLPDPE